jgi:thiol:disulfide interchange protein DsbD
LGPCGRQLRRTIEKILRAHIIVALLLLAQLIGPLGSCLGITTRTTEIRHEGIDHYVFATLDYQVEKGTHLTAPVGKGIHISPKVEWTNAVVIAEKWPQSEVILESDGKESDYHGYCNDFSVIYKLKLKKYKSPIGYDVTYVVCGNACVPKQESGQMAIDGRLSDQEVVAAFGPQKEQSILLEVLLSILCGLLGGLILNCMPCVFPIISLKVFSLVKTAQEGVESIRKHSLAILLGNVGFFTLFGAAIIGIRQTFEGIGWGFYMQNPTFVFFMLVLFLTCALNFFGVFSFNMPLISRINVKNSYVADACGGALSVLVSTACVGPFSGIAIATALLNDNIGQSLSIFFALGLGLGLPFLLITIWPQFANIIPKPGKWLQLFKEFMGFAMLLSCVWPIWILMTQVQTANLVIVLICGILIGLFTWAWQHAKHSLYFRSIPIMGLVASIAIGAYSTVPTKPKPAHRTIVWQDYSDEVFDDLIMKKKPVFLDFTAAWCLTCKFNERLFADQEIVSEFRKKKVNAIKCDWTNKNDRITELLKEYDSVAVPLYIYYPGNGVEFVKLSPMLTKDEVLAALRRGES